MDTSKNLDERTMMDAWAYIQAQADAGIPLKPNAYRLAFGDPEFLLRRETRGIRLQLELLKPDLDQKAQGIENTIVVFGSARFVSPADAQAAITWSSGVSAALKTDVSAKALIGRSSGESLQMAFTGQGWVLVQPSEGRVVLGGSGGGGGLGSLLSGG